jgi:diguanylate cyclase (GGDEF)-like protein
MRWIAHGCRAVYAKDGRFMGRRASNRDITDRKQAEELVQQLAYYDTLTDLPNRRLLLDRLGHALTQARRYERSLAIMFLDLDNFKQINDTLGHDAGDALLREVAGRLTTCIRGGDTVARQGGDEFIVVLAEISQPEDAALVADKIIAALGEPMHIAERTLNVTTSIGIAVYPVNGDDDAQELMKKADQAMYAAKAAGRNGYRFFAPAATV